MFIKCNLKMPVSPTNRDAVAKAELELRRRQAKAVELFRQYVPGCEKAFIARTSPTLCIRRGRLIACDYDITLPDVLEGAALRRRRHGLRLPRLRPAAADQERRHLRHPVPGPARDGHREPLACGMMITSDHEAHMSTRNTVCCMGQGQAAGTAAALCAAKNLGTRDLKYPVLREALTKAGVYFES